MDSLGLEEHMLGTAEADTLSAKLHCVCSISRCICVGTNAQLTEAVSPVHDPLEVSANGSLLSLDIAFVDLTCGSV